LYAWLKGSPQNQQLFRDLCDTDEMESQLKELGEYDTDAAWQRVCAKIEAAGAGKPAMRKYRKGWWQAAAALLVLALATWPIVRYSNVSKPAIPAKLTSVYGADIPPGTFKGELVLSNGTSVSLGNNGDTTFMENGNSIMRTPDGTITYGKGAGAGGSLAWNTLRIPNAGEYRVVLADGTTVWLNAASVLRYPVQFGGKERKVELLEGEAYFEVAKSKEKPFIVVADHMEIRAVGTAFNVNRYIVGSMSATLTEGKVKVSLGNTMGLLVPGEQAHADAKGMRIVKADVEQVMAWKNGLFMFSGTALPEVMQQVARWYDVRIEYDKAFTEKKFFTGEISREVPVSKLLQMMELTGIARFRITGNTVMVLPYTS
jgi:ferric-dicitrate binding protein FerR (iron transport regulator)